MGFFEKVQTLSPDPILGLAISYKEDRRTSKVDLGVGSYLTADLSPLILTSVKEAEKRLLEQEKSKDYLPIEGDKLYLELTYKLLFGDTLIEEAAAIQAIGGTGALRLGGDFLRIAGFSTIALPHPTWGNHRNIFTQAGLKVEEIPYYNSSSHTFDCASFLEGLERADRGSVILLHGCCHNPTGLDPTLDEWRAILDKIKERGHFPFFDIAYQGFGVGIEEDAAAIRLFKEAGIEMAVALSYSKNFGLYAERIGALFVIAHNKREKEATLSQLKHLARGNYSNPPCHGARIVTEILRDKELMLAWTHELSSMRGRISAMRTALAAALEAKSPPGKEPFAHIAKAKGMFAFTGLRSDQVDQLISEYGIYLLKNGRINLAGLNTENMSYVAEAISAV